MWVLVSRHKIVSHDPCFLLSAQRNSLSHHNLVHKFTLATTLVSRSCDNLRRLLEGYSLFFYVTVNLDPKVNLILLSGTMFLTCMLVF